MPPPEPLALQVERALAREPAIALMSLEPEDDCINFTVQLNGRTWELVALPVKMSRPIDSHERLQAWIGGSMTPIGALVDDRRTLTERLTPVRLYVDLALPIGNRVVCDELDHVIPAKIDGGVVGPYHGIVVDELADDGTVGVLLLGARW